MKVVFLEPPHNYWPMISKDFDRFLMPFSFLSLAGKLLEHDSITPLVWDCNTLRWGWKTLEAKLRAARPEVVCLGPKVTFAPEAARAFRLAKDVDPSVVTIGGGYLFSALGFDALGDAPVDTVIRWEGETALEELLLDLASGSARPEKIPGLLLRQAGEIRETPLRPLIEDLDRLPYPAYVGLPNREDYGIGPGRYPGTIALQHSRGCPATCTFCSSWDQEGRHGYVEGALAGFPSYRTKSVERTVEEMERFGAAFGKRHFVFLDSTWNVDPAWNDAFAGKLLGRGSQVSWYAFLRGDYALRDEELGILEKMVRSGLTHAFIGVERPEDGDLEKLRKGYSSDMTRRVADLFRRRYPHVVTQGALLMGTPDETPESAANLVDYALALGMDFVSLYILTPHPGTDLWREASSAGLIETADLAEYDWLYPVMRSRHMTREEIYRAAASYSPRLARRRLVPVARGLVDPNAFKRAAYRHFVRKSIEVLWLSRSQPADRRWRMVRPDWIDS